MRGPGLCGYSNPACVSRHVDPKVCLGSPFLWPTVQLKRRRSRIARLDWGSPAGRPPGPEFKPWASTVQGRRDRGDRGRLGKRQRGSFIGKRRHASVSTDASAGPLNLLLRADGPEDEAACRDPVAVHRPRGARQDRVDRPLRLRHEAGPADGPGARPEDGRHDSGGRREQFRRQTAHRS